MVSRSFISLVPGILLALSFSACMDPGHTDETSSGEPVPPVEENEPIGERPPDEKPDPDPEEIDHGPVGFRDAFYPMAVWNTWKYEGTLMLEDDTVVSHGTRSITGYRYDSTRNNVWWQFGSYELMQTENAILIQWQTSTGDWEIGLLFKIPEANVDTLRYNATDYVDDDVAMDITAVRIGTYSTPAGEFEDCISYAIPIQQRPVPVTRIICPQVGIVAAEEQYVNNDRLLTRLVSYELVR
jgi:hypothetical protein